MKYLSFVYTILLLIITTQINAQSVDEIINKHLQAIGGKEKLNTITSIYSEGEVATSSGLQSTMTGEYKVYTLNGKGLREEIIFKAIKNVEGYTQKQAWRIQGKPDAEPLSAAMAAAGQARFTIYGPLANYSTNGSKVELLGKEDVDGTEAFYVKLTTGDNTEFYYWIDPSSFYIVKRVIKSKSGEHLRTDTFSDYRKTDEGIVYPFASVFKLEISNEFYVIVNKVEINKEIDTSIFDMPK